MSQQSVGQAARRSALDTQAVPPKEWADREGSLKGLAVAVLTASVKRDALVRDAERRARQALRTMTDDEGLSVRQAVGWCGSGLTNSRTPLSVGLIVRGRTPRLRTRSPAVRPAARTWWSYRYGS